MDVIVKGMAFGKSGYATATRSIVECLRRRGIGIIVLVVFIDSPT